MKQSHYTTPRTLNECQWTPGYQSISKEQPWEKMAGYLLATIIGIALAAALVIGWSS